ncbi:hypothetical protein AB4Z09_27200, partial [Rhodococcus sp. TAF43]|uniref:hypothetical protein n=1 Tax=Rhodococcus sp. TAF43 TaxID=3237483 RepID=UPI003F9E9911
MARRIVATTLLTGAALAAALVQPAAAGAVSDIPGGLNYPVVYNIHVDHNLGVAAQRSGLPQALHAADIRVPIPGWELVINNHAWATDEATRYAAAAPNHCADIALRANGARSYVQADTYPCWRMVHARTFRPTPTPADSSNGRPRRS